MSTFFTSLFDNLPDTAFIREKQLVKQSKEVSQPTLLPFSRSTLWREIRHRRFPAPTRISPGINGWRLGEVLTWAKDPEAYARSQIEEGKA
jgi:prophage regulatory protein